MTKDIGRVGIADQALVSDQAELHRLDPTGFDPSRIAGMPWRDISTVPTDGTIVAVWCREWNRPDGNPRIQFAQWLDPYLTGGKLCAPYDHNNQPYANGWMPCDELNAIAIETRQGGDAKQGSVEDESAGRQALPKDGTSPTPQHKE